MMDRAEIETKVIEIVAKQFATSKEKVTRTTRFQEDLSGDSLDTVEFVMELEDAFNIEIPDSMSDKIKAVGDVIDFVEKAPKKA
jgi:acyl carrier protein